MSGQLKLPPSSYEVWADITTQFRCTMNKKFSLLLRNQLKWHHQVFRDFFRSKDSYIVETCFFFWLWHPGGCNDANINIGISWKY